MIAVRTLYVRRERAVNTLQQLLARRRSVIDAIKTLLGTPCGRCRDAARTLCTRYMYYWYI